MTNRYKESNILPTEERQKELISDFQIPQMMDGESERDYRQRLTEKLTAFLMISARHITPRQQVVIDSLNEEIRASFRRAPLKQEDWENINRNMLRALAEDSYSR